MGLVKPGSTSSRFKLTKEGYDFLAPRKLKKKISTKRKKKIIMKRKNNYAMSIATTSSKVTILKATKTSKSGNSDHSSIRTIQTTLVKSLGKDMASHVNRAVRKTMQNNLAKARITSLRFKVTVEGFASLKSSQKKKSSKKMARKISRSARTPSSKLKILIAMKKMRNGHTKGCSRQAIKREVASSSGKVIASHVFRRAMKLSMESGLVKAGSTTSRYKLTTEGYEYITSSMAKKKKSKRVENKEIGKKRAIKRTIKAEKFTKAKRK